MSNRIVLFSFLCLIIITPLCLSATDVQQGAVAFVAYNPIGISVGGRVPYDEEPKGSVDTTTEGGLSSLSSFSISGGYFYDIWMGELLYNSHTVSDQQIERSTPGGTESIVYDLSTFEARAGLRFSDYGDASYTFLYTGYKYLSYDTKYYDIELSGHGFTVGVTTFQTFFPQWDFEPALYLNAYLGNYRVTDFKSSVSTDYERTKSISVGGTIGAGVHYEPYNVALLAIAQAGIEQISHSVKVDDGWVDFGVRHTGFYFGGAVVYQHLNFKYNH